MRYQFLIDTYRTEIEKVVSVWAMFHDEDMVRRPHPSDERGRNLHEQMVHQCTSENLWFSTMLGISVTDRPLPLEESRVDFMQAYLDAALRRLAALEKQSESWWEEEVDFFEVKRSRAWVMTRRIAHTSHHRGQQMAMLRMFNRPVHSNYGPTADTGGLMQNRAPIIYPYPDVETLLREESAGRRKSPLPGAGDRPVTERPAGSG